MCPDSALSSDVPVSCGLLSSSAPGRRHFLSTSVQESVSLEGDCPRTAAANMRANHVAALQQHQLPTPESAAAIKEAFQK